MLCCGCSTVERHTYYSPQAATPQISGPDPLPCGFANFGGLPDRFTLKTQEHFFSIAAYQHSHVQMAGPWFLAILPIFPFTWIYDLVEKDPLRVTITFNPNSLTRLSNASIVAVMPQKDGKPTELLPSSTALQKNDLILVFPLKSSRTDEFTLRITEKGAEQPFLEIPFKRTSRWSWTQWTPNC